MQIILPKQLPVVLHFQFLLYILYKEIITIIIIFIIIWIVTAIDRENSLLI